MGYVKLVREISEMNAISLGTRSIRQILCRRAWLDDLVYAKLVREISKTKASCIGTCSV